MKILEHRIAEALQDQIFRQSLLKHGIRHESADLFMSVYMVLQDLPNLPTITQTSNVRKIHPHSADEEPKMVLKLRLNSIARAERERTVRKICPAPSAVSGRRWPDFM